MDYMLSLGYALGRNADKQWEEQMMLEEERMCVGIRRVLRHKVESRLGCSPSTTACSQLDKHVVSFITMIQASRLLLRQI